ncbi:DUF397 domain-containing protein [Streptomyces sp. NEAU-174]|uniref:DUF397 domain-containing protein n=1 Tax=Streptomyces sp. NEAU-174 TaxID=3458254 RepID=UPI0040448C70
MTGPEAGDRFQDRVPHRGVPGAVAIRDSKDPGGRILRFTPAAWAVFRVGLADGWIGSAPGA